MHKPLCSLPQVHPPFQADASPVRLCRPQVLIAGTTVRGSAARGANGAGGAERGKDALLPLYFPTDHGDFQPARNSALPAHAPLLNRLWCSSVADQLCRVPSEIPAREARLLSTWRSPGTPAQRWPLAGAPGRAVCLAFPSVVGKILRDTI